MDQNTANPPNISKAKPPPIHVYTNNMKQLINLIITGKIPEGNFWVRNSNKNYIIIRAINIETYRLIKEILQTNKVQFYTYTPKKDKIISLVLKGLTPEYDENDVSTYTTNKNLPNINIKRVTKLKLSKTEEDKFFFIVQLTNGSKPAELTRINQMLHQLICWERLKKKSVFQCRRCQRVGHSSNNCHLEFRCVKCGKNHGPIKEGAKCEIETTGDENLLKCINCGEYGHTASYFGCKYLKLA